MSKRDNESIGAVWVAVSVIVTLLWVSVIPLNFMAYIVLSSGTAVLIIMGAYFTYKLHKDIKSDTQ